MMGRRKRSRLPASKDKLLGAVGHSAEPGSRSSAHWTGDPARGSWPGRSPSMRSADLTRTPEMQQLLALRLATPVFSQQLPFAPGWVGITKV